MRQICGVGVVLLAVAITAAGAELTALRRLVRESAGLAFSAGTGRVRYDQRTRHHRV